MSLDRSDIAELFAEASTRGERGEFFDGDSYSFRRLGSLKDAAFHRLCAKLQQDNWRRTNPEKVREYRGRAAAKPERKAYRAAWKKKALDRKWAARPKCVCAWCGVQFERINRVGPVPKFCKPAHNRKAWDAARRRE